MERLNRELDRAAALRDPVRRQVKIAAIIAEALRSVGQDPVLVGGAAVEFYSRGGYSTGDIDFVALGGSDVVRVMESLRFEKIGKDFVNRRREIYVEFPGSSLGPQERAQAISIDGMPLKIISLEDLIVDRLCAYKFWKSGLDGFNAMLLLENTDVDRSRLEQRSSQEDVLDALQVVEQTREEAIRKKLPKSEANSLLEKRMRSL